MSEKQSYAAGESVFQGGESTLHFYIPATERIRLPLSEGGQVAYMLNNTVFVVQHGESGGIYVVGADCLAPRCCPN